MYVTDFNKSTFLSNKLATIDNGILGQMENLSNHDELPLQPSLSMMVMNCSSILLLKFQITHSRSILPIASISGPEPLHNSQQTSNSMLPHPGLISSCFTEKAVSLISQEILLSVVGTMHLPPSYLHPFVAEMQHYLKCTLSLTHTHVFGEEKALFQRAKLGGKAPPPSSKWLSFASM